MKKKNIIIFIISLLVLIILALTVYFFFIYKSPSDLSLSEKRWIESKKNKMIEISIQNNIPIYNYNGEGVILDFLDEFEDSIGLEFDRFTDADDDNIVRFIQKDTIDKDDILVQEDYSVLVTKNSERYVTYQDIPKMTIGVLSSELEKVKKILNNQNLLYKTFDNENSILSELKKDNSSINGAIVSKTNNLDFIIENNYTISSSLIDLKKYLVFDLGKDNDFNKILEKYYKKWSTENLDEQVESQFINLYYNLRKVTDREKSIIKSKNYVFGFVEDKPYNSLLGKNLIGSNYYLIRDFSRMNQIEIKYKKYENYASLKKDFKDGKIDFIFNTTSNLDEYKNNGIYDNIGVIVSNYKNSVNASSLSGIQDKNLMVVKDSQIQSVLDENNISYKSYNNIEELINKVNNNSIVALDNYQFMYYQKNKLKNFYINFTFKMVPYGYTINEKTASNVLSDMFDFYSSYVNYKDIASKGIKDYDEEHNSLILIFNILLYIFAGLGVLLSMKALYNKVSTPREKNKKLGKEDKIKYIDQLTSLKNRTYLNDQLDTWEKNDIYPQSIIIVDLNNVAYINDNFGHEEGDALICKAANILIQNQLINSEIIRTSGNEFLIYLVGFDEKQIVSYIKKLSKEMKTLPHDFGAAIGYSMIKDDIKTIDDAINESTLDMKTNKEEVKNHG